MGGAGMTPLERRAAFRYAAALQNITMATAARRLGVSYNHLMLVLTNQRDGSNRLKKGVAAFVGRRVEDVFGEDPAPAA